MSEAAITAEPESSSLDAVAAGGRSRLWDFVTRVTVRLSAQVHPTAKILGRVRLVGGGALVIGPWCLLDGTESPIEFCVQRGALVSLGANTVVGSGCSFDSQRRIETGDNVVIGRDCKIMDSHFHPVRGARSDAGYTSVTRIEHDSRLGDGVIVLAGVTIGEQCECLPATVVSRSIPPGSTVYGNPMMIRRSGSGDRNAR